MNQFFGIEVPSNGIGSMTFALLLAVLLGGAIGFEREFHGHSAGLRTHVLVCVGATLMTVVSVQMAIHAVPRQDPTRIAAQIVSGVGFLGAGAIIREGATIRGLTTAASIWTTAGIGIALGAGPFLAELAIIATTIVLFTLFGLNLLEDWVERKIRRVQNLELHVQAGEGAVAAALAKVADCGVSVMSIEYETGLDKDERQMLMRIKLPGDFNIHKFLADLGTEPRITHAHLS